jgi:LacI family transcriptional regulator
VADSLGYRRLTLHRTLVAESAPEKLAKSLIRSSKSAMR